MENIDFWILAKVERFAHFTQRWFGIAAPSWERLFLVLAFVQVILKEIPRDWGKAFMSVMDGILLMMFIGRFLSSLKRTPCTGEDATMNPNKIRDQWSRPIGLFLALFFLPFDIVTQFEAHPRNSLWFQCSQIACYFAACDVLPWSRSKILKMLRSAANALRLQPRLVHARASSRANLRSTSAECSVYSTLLT